MNWITTVLYFGLMAYWFFSVTKARRERDAWKAAALKWESAANEWESLRKGENVYFPKLDKDA